MRTHWVTVSEAARELRISPVAVRKQIAARTLTGVRVGRGWRVLLPESATTVTYVPDARDEDDALFARTAESLVTLVHDLPRQSLGLAGQIGYLQSQLVQAQEQVKLLEERSETHAPGVPVEEHEAALREIAELKAMLDATSQRKRRWWRLGR